MVFPDKSTGSFLREDSKRKGITNENPLAVPISEIKTTFEIPKIRIKVSRSQVPHGPLFLYDKLQVSGSNPAGCDCGL